MFKKKPIFFALFALAVSVPASAVESQHIATFDGNGSDYNGFEYNVNLDLNRAWVELSFDTWDSEGSSTSEVAQAVRGLYFEPATQEVRYNNGSGTTICAVRKRKRRLGIFPYVVYETTGRCDVQMQRATRTRDDGMHNPVVTPIEKFYFVVR